MLEHGSSLVGGGMSRVLCISTQAFTHDKNGDTQMSMSKKDYEAVADVLGTLYTQERAVGRKKEADGVKFALESLSDAFGKENSRFQPETFKERFDAAAKAMVKNYARKVSAR